MYYECAPKWQSSANTEIEGLASICLAGSIDGWNYLKQREVGGARSWIHPSAESETNFATPVIRSQKAELACGAAESGGRRRLATIVINGQTVCPQQTTATSAGYLTPVGWYGAGHPSIVRLPDGRVRMFYYDGGDGAQGHAFAPVAWHFTDSWDGIHFGGSSLPSGNIPFGGDYKYDNAKQIFLGLRDFFWGFPLGTIAYSHVTLTQPYWTGINGQWVTRTDTETGDRLIIGKSCNPQYQQTPSAPTIVSDENGWINLDQPVVIFNGEKPNPTYCQSLNQDQANSWGIYRISGRFTVVP